MTSTPPAEDGSLRFVQAGNQVLYALPTAPEEWLPAGSPNTERIIPLMAVASWNYFDAGFVINYKDGSREVMPWTSVLGSLSVHPNSPEYIVAQDKYLDEVHNEHADGPGLIEGCVRCHEQAHRDQMMAMGFVYIDVSDNAIDHNEEGS